MFYLFNPSKTFTGLSCVDTQPSLCSFGMHAVYHPIPCYYSNRMLLTINMSIKCMTLSFPSHSVTAGETPRQRTEATQSLPWLGGNAVWRFVEEAECQGYLVARLQPCLYVFCVMVKLFQEKEVKRLLSLKKAPMCIYLKSSSQRPLMMVGLRYTVWPVFCWLQSHNRRIPGRHAVFWMIQLCSQRRNTCYSDTHFKCRLSTASPYKYKI